MQNPKKPATLRRALGFSTACGVDFALVIMLGIGIGSTLDAHFRSSPLYLLVGLFVGLALGVYTAYLILRPLLRTL